MTAEVAAGVGDCREGTEADWGAAAGFGVVLARITRFIAASNAASSISVIGRVFEDELRRGFFGLDEAEADVDQS